MIEIPRLFMTKMFYRYPMHVLIFNISLYFKKIILKNESCGSHHVHILPLYLEVSTIFNYVIFPLSEADVYPCYSPRKG